MNLNYSDPQDAEAELGETGPWGNVNQAQSKHRLVVGESQAALNYRQQTWLP